MHTDDGDCDTDDSWISEPCGDDSSSTETELQSLLGLLATHQEHMRQQLAALTPDDPDYHGLVGALERAIQSERRVREYHQLDAMRAPSSGRRRAASCDGDGGSNSSEWGTSEGSSDDEAKPAVPRSGGGASSNHSSDTDDSWISESCDGNSDGGGSVTTGQRDGQPLAGDGDSSSAETQLQGLLGLLATHQEHMRQQLAALSPDDPDYHGLVASLEYAIQSERRAREYHQLDAMRLSS